MRAYLTHCRLRNGATCDLTFIGRHSCDAILAAIDKFGDQLRSCSAKPAP